ncbi:hypothetical protein V3C99_002458 [Haemonchus contortus]
MLVCYFLFAIVGLSTASIRSRRQAALAVNQQDIPITLRSLITCLTPIKDYLCLGPRVEVLKNERIGLTDRRGAAYGYVDGVDIGLLRPLNVPMIEDETEVGHHIGAVVDVTDRDGVVEFGDRLKVFKALRLNNGGIAEWDRLGGGADVGSRLSAADDAVKLRWTLLGVNVGPNASRTIIGPGPNTLGRAKGASLKTYTPFPYFYRGYYERGDWYRNQFYNQGNEYKTPAQRACPWCFAVDPTYPVQQRLIP